MFLLQAMPMTRHWGRWEVIGRPSRGFAESPSRYPAGSHTEDHENGAVSTSEGGAVSRPDDVSSSSICFYVRAIIPISRAFDARRTPDFFSYSPPGKCVLHRLFLPIRGGGTRERVLQSENGSIEEIRKASPSCISHHLRIYLSTYAKSPLTASICFSFLCTLHK